MIVASILSKKLAAGLDALVMDVKAGSGAFLPSLEETRELAAAIVEVARGNGLATSALLTDMNQVLGRTAGNAVEVLESIEVLTDPGAGDRAAGRGDARAERRAARAGRARARPASGTRRGRTRALEW